jgi:hypothetical protein
MVSGITQRQKVPRISKFIEVQKQNTGYQRLGGGGIWELLFDRFVASFWDCGGSGHVQW